MKRLIAICLGYVLLTTTAWGSVLPLDITFDEIGNGYAGETQLMYGVGLPLIGHATLYYELPAVIIEGDVVIYELDTSSEVSDLLRFLNVQGPTGDLTGRVYVYSDLPEAGEPIALADTGIPDVYLSNILETVEQENEYGWKGLKGYTPQPGAGDSNSWPGYVEDGITIYNFTSDVPELATVAMLGLGALSLIRSSRRRHEP